MNDISKSYPYLSISKKYDADYSDVLLAVQRVTRGLASQWQDAPKDDEAHAIMRLVDFHPQAAAIERDIMAAAERFLRIQNGDLDWNE